MNAHTSDRKGGWIGVDLDGTLAEHNSSAPFNPNQIGPPIPRMVERVKRWLAEGKEVRIFTARVSSMHSDARLQEMQIREWCMRHLGKALVVTNEKDSKMLELWDDRAVQVVPNEGRRVDGKS